MEGREFLLSTEIKDQIIPSKFDSEIESFLKEIEERLRSSKNRIYLPHHQRKFSVLDCIKTKDCMEIEKKEDEMNALMNLLFFSFLVNILLYYWGSF